MAGFQTPITINEAMQRIKNNEYLLPAFQRGYAWGEENAKKGAEKIELLFDSLMKDYPINSMLFWKVKDESKTAWKFYNFLDYFRERYHRRNNLFNTKGHKDFYAILDGQQRLTSLHLALHSRYEIHKQNNRWEDNDKYFKICHFYFNLTQSQSLPEDSDIEYQFKWLDKNDTEEVTIYIDGYEQRWFKVGDFYKYETSRVRNISKQYNLDDREEERLDLLHQKIFDKQFINFYLEEEQNPDKAVHIFIRTNSTGAKLSFADILFSIAIANWKDLDARTEINELIDFIGRDFSFKIDKDLILKGFLYLFHNSVNFQINSFDKNFIETIETKWEGIKNCFIETFRLLKSFGLNASTLSSNNAVLPILYFIYHKNLTEQIVNSKSQKENRQIIKKWLLRALILKPFGGSGDTVLTNMRKAFIKDFKQNGGNYFDENIDKFPLEKIEKEARYTQNIDDEFLEEKEIIYYRKNDAETFAILSLLYPNLDYENNDFHKDHLHATNLYKEYEKIGEIKHKKDSNYNYWAFEMYDSLPNLQMLDANENKAKQDKPLEQWVQENCGNDRKGFLKKHLIPDIDLSLENFDDFYEARKVLLIKRLKEILN